MYIRNILTKDFKDGGLIEVLFIGYITRAAE